MLIDSINKFRTYVVQDEATFHREMCANIFIPVELISMAFSFVFAVHTLFCSTSFLLFFKSIRLIFKRKRPTIRELISNSNVFRIQLVLDGRIWCADSSCYSFWLFSLTNFFDNFFQVSFPRSLAFERIGDCETSLFGHLRRAFLSLVLIYYFVMWVEFTCIELHMTKPEWKVRKQKCETRREIRDSVVSDKRAASMRMIWAEASSI